MFGNFQHTSVWFSDGLFFTWESCCKKQLTTKQNLCSGQKADFSLFFSCWCVLPDYISRMSTHHLLCKWDGDVSEDLKVPGSSLPLAYELPCGSNLWCMPRVPRSTVLNPLRNMVRVCTHNAFQLSLFPYLIFVWYLVGSRLISKWKEYRLYCWTCSKMKSFPFFSSPPHFLYSILWFLWKQCSLCHARLALVLIKQMATYDSLFLHHKVWRSGHMSGWSVATTVRIM